MDDQNKAGGLCLTIKVGKAFSIGNAIVQVLSRSGSYVKLRIIAHESLPIRRDVTPKQES